MKLELGMLVDVKPSFLEERHSTHGEPLWENPFSVRHVDGEGIHVREETKRHNMPGRRWLLVPHEDLLREHAPAPAKPKAAPDRLTGLTLAEEDARYCARRDANLRGAEPVLYGLDPSRLVYLTPYGEISVAELARYDGQLMSSLPADITVKARWIIDNVKGG